MKFGLMLVLLAINTGWAQDSSTRQQSSPIPQVSVFQRYSGLRQGRDQEILVVLCAKRPGCPGCRFSLTQQEGGFHPLTFKLEDTDDLTISYRKGNRYMQVAANRVIEVTPKHNVIALKIRSKPDVQQGTKTVRGQLAYGVAGATAGSAGSLSFSVPLQIISPDANISKTEWPYASHLGKHIAAVFEAPLTGFEYLMLFIACHGGGCDL